MSYDGEDIRMCHDLAFQLEPFYRVQFTMNRDHSDGCCCGVNHHGRLRRDVSIRPVVQSLLSLENRSSPWTLQALRRDAHSRVAFLTLSGHPRMSHMTSLLRSGHDLPGFRLRSSDYGLNYM